MPLNYLIPFLCTLGLMAMMHFVAKIAIKRPIFTFIFILYALQGAYEHNELKFVFSAWLLLFDIWTAKQPKIKKKSTSNPSNP